MTAKMTCVICGDPLQWQPAPATEGDKRDRTRWAVRCRDRKRRLCADCMPDARK